MYRIRSVCTRRLKSTLALSKTSNEYLNVKLNGKDVEFSTFFLRDSCTSPESMDPFSKQKLFTTAELLSRKFSINKAEVRDDILHVEWSENGRAIESKYPAEFLERAYQKSVNKIDQFYENRKVYWDNRKISAVLQELQSDESDYLTSKSEFKKVADNLNNYGLSFVNNIRRPQLDKMTEENSTQWPVFKLAEKFGYIKKTFYGTLFDVKNEKEAKNIANTNTFLPLHMDLLYYESPPGLQFLHFIDNSTLGGDNVFSDSFLAAEHVRETDPEAYQALLEVPITYHYHNNNEHYFYKRPLVVEYDDVLVDGKKRIKVVNYSPPFQGPFEFGVTKADAKKFGDFLRGLKSFEDFINDPKNSVQIKMQEGSCVIFDNRRVLHSRLEFSDENGGDRWLMGTYVDGDSFRSKVRVCNE